MKKIVKSLAQLKDSAPNQGGMTPDELKRLSQNSLFADLPQRRVLAALKNCPCLRLAEGKEVYRRGESGKEMCLVLSGGVKVGIFSACGKEIVFDLLGEGDFFGELSLLDGKPRTATVTTLVPSVLVVLDRTCLMSLMQKNSVISTQLLHALARRIRAVNALLEEVHFFDSETRLAKRVMVLKNIYGKAIGDSSEIELRISQQNIANLVGITRESVNKHLKKWEKTGIVSLGPRRLVIRNASGLQELAQEAGS